MQVKMPDRRRSPLWIVIVLILLAIVLAVAAYAMTRQGNDKGGGDGSGPNAATAEEAVRQGLATLRQLGGTPMAGATGLQADEAARAQPAPAFPVYFVPLDALKAYREGVDPGSLMRELPVSMVPLLVDGEVRSSMTITRSDGGFTASAFGDVARARSAAEARANGAGDFILRVPALGFEFVGRRADGRLMLTATSDDPRLRLQAGQAVSAEAVLQQLVPLARAETGDAPM